jgi:AcrR family transcriptional regulator
MRRGSIETRERAAGRPDLLRREKLAAAPQQKRSIERRGRLKEAALALFGEKGYEGTSIGEIARRARLPVGSFYQHYRSKKQLLVALMDEFLEGLAGLDLRLAAGGVQGASRGVREGLRDFLAAAFRMDAAYYGAVRAWQEASLADAELRELRREIERWTDARVLGVFQALQRHPQARKGGDLEAFARMMNRHFWSMLARGSRMTAKEFEREVGVSADVIYRFLFAGHRGTEVAE